MKNLVRFTFVFVLLMSFTLFSSAENRTLQLDDFTKIQLTSAFKVILKQGNQQKVTVEGSKETLDRLNTTVSNNTWKIYSKRKKNSWGDYSSENLTIYITIPKLEKISVTGSGKVKSSHFDVEDLKISVTGSGKLTMEVKAKGALMTSVSGSGKIKLNGSAQSMKAKITGSGDIMAENVKVNTANAHITGSGDIYIHAAKSLNAHVTGSGDIHYKGKPNVNSKTTGSGKVRKI